MISNYGAEPRAKSNSNSVTTYPIPLKKLDSNSDSRRNSIMGKQEGKEHRLTVGLSIITQHLSQTSKREVEYNIINK
jgi:hypothetical protein